MAEFINNLKEKAKEKPKRIVLPEGEEERIIKAAGIISQKKIAIPLLLGNIEKIKEKAHYLKIDLSHIEIIDPFNFAKTSEYISFYCQMRKDHSLSKKIARMVLAKNLNLGALMVRLGEGDGLVAGACNLTSSIIKSATLMLGLREGISLPSSFFIMATPDSSVGEEGLLIFADVAVNPEPDSSQLADIAISTAMSAKALLGWQPRVALLSFSTKRSASHPLVDKVTEASRIAQEKAPHLLIEGELQADAALIPQIAERKIKESKVAGRANILIFPDLNAANISYKLVQYLAKARAYGPILQGFARPINDLSRGATVEDIVSVIIITAVQAQKRRD
jgi:phosphate acetyltransferase